MDQIYNLQSMPWITNKNRVG